MAPYRSSTGLDWQEALALYEWNTRVSSAFFESLHYLEVGLRNALDHAASSRLGEHWLTPSSAVLTLRSRAAVDAARRHAGGLLAPHGKVVAELPFGFWWSLLADEYNRRLWQPALRYAFEAPVRRRRLHTELNDLRRLRNRIAHHEPIHARRLDEDLKRIVEISTRIGAELGQHVAVTSRVQELLAERRR